MALKVFVTGATGYVGGTAFAYIYNAHKDNEYTLLVRNEARAQVVKEKYPTVKFVYGGLDDVDIIEQAASEADVVVHTADSSDHVPSATAIIKGLQKGHTAEKPGYWLHLSGTGILTWYDLVNGREGQAPLPEQKYHDINDIERIQNLDDRAPHRDVDKIVIAANSDAVKIAILCPPLIYGKGSGPGNTETIQIPTLVDMTLRERFAPVVGDGKNEWDYVHIDDLGDLFVKLFDATQDPSKNTNPEIFGPNGYFYSPYGTLNFEKIAERVAEEIKKQGYLADVPIKHVSFAEQTKLKGYHPVAETLGHNSKGVAERASKYLGWAPKQPISVEDDVAEVVSQRAKRLGL
ncbi:hypothetical protein TrVFT333_003164 [Trichoderma virens FT-333]|nr:hypothetical protein TrVFT333_003164 [Trichoderma virens FT-333]